MHGTGPTKLTPQSCLLIGQPLGTKLDGLDLLIKLPRSKDSDIKELQRFCRKNIIQYSTASFSEFSNYLLTPLFVEQPRLDRAVNYSVDKLGVHYIF